MLRFSTFPRTKAPGHHVQAVVKVFEGHLPEIGTVKLKKGLTSDGVVSVLRDDLVELGWDVERGKRTEQKVRRPVFFGENAVPDLQYEVDAWHADWRSGMEVEAGRAWMGNAVYRDLIQALVMVDMEFLFLAVPQSYKYNAGGRDTISRDYENTIAVAEAFYGHSRIRMPFDLCVIGY